MAAPAAFQTVVKNPASSGSKYYMYLGDHGATLAAGATYTFDGDLASYLRAKDKRKYNTFATDLAAGDIAYVSIPGGGGTGTVGSAAIEPSLVPGAGFNRTVLTITNLSVTMTDATTSGSYGGALLLTLPEGLVYVIGAVTNLTVTAAAGITATAALKHAVGTVLTSSSDTLTSTLADIIPSTSTTLAASAGSPKGVSTSVRGLIDGSTTPAAIYLNFGVADAGSTANSTLTVNGTVTISWLFIADK